jgi:cell filamentation protein, protein adenylyltransferase
MPRMYRAEPDPYCYPATTVLINRLGTTDQSILGAFEAEMTSQRAAEPLPTGRLSYSHYRSIHRHFFQDVYRWAGRIRTVRISKGSSEFCYPENIDREMRRLFASLTAQKYFRGLGALKFAENAAHFLAELNAIHPFREGNGRMQLTFLTILAQDAGHQLNLERLDPAAMLAAMVASFRGDEAPLAGIILELVR